MQNHTFTGRPTGRCIMCQNYADKHDLGCLHITRRGDLIHLDANGYKDFAPGTQRILQWAIGALLAIMVIGGLGLGSGIIPPTPWSPMGMQQQEQHRDPSPRTNDVRHA